MYHDGFVRACVHRRSWNNIIHVGFSCLNFRAVMTHPHKAGELSKSASSSASGLKRRVSSSVPAQSLIASGACRYDVALTGGKSREKTWRSPCEDRKKSMRRQGAQTFRERCCSLSFLLFLFNICHCFSFPIPTASLFFTVSPSYFHCFSFSFPTNPPWSVSLFRLSCIGCLARRAPRGHSWNARQAGRAGRDGRRIRGGCLVLQPRAWRA